ncbi:crustacyanin-A2 subunit-like [Penaeus monodon]|uniref:crustacyanin-A2 subunit-like n=1 Tax=Penaeus monodon TaxID=6687 RepID=UPI0018A79179|nr:crustacyanin-A2 subunit-like [Penaeus monodon]
MLKVLVAAALVALVSADSIPGFVAPGNFVWVANQDNFDLLRVSFLIIMLVAGISSKSSASPYTRCDYDYSDYGFKVTAAGFSPNNEYLRLQGKIYPTKDFPAAYVLIDFPSA